MDAHARDISVRNRVSANRQWMLELRDRVTHLDRLLRIRKKLAAGFLPSDLPTTVVQAPSAGQRCTGCDRIAAPTKPVMVCAVRYGQKFHLDADCYEVWQKLRRYCRQHV